MGGDEPWAHAGGPTAMPENTHERPPVESEAIDERDVEPMGEGHVESDPVPHPEMPPPSYEANQGTGGRDAHPGGSTDDHSYLVASDSGDDTER